MSMESELERDAALLSRRYTCVNVDTPTEKRYNPTMIENIHIMHFLRYLETLAT